MSSSRHNGSRCDESRSNGSKSLWWSLCVWSCTCWYGACLHECHLVIHCTRMWIHWRSHMTYLGQVQQNCRCCQRSWSSRYDPKSKLVASMMVLCATHGPAPMLSPLREVGQHQTGVDLQSLSIWTQHQKAHQAQNLEREAPPPVSSSVLPAQQSGHCPLWGVGLKWRGRGNSVK